MSRKSQTRWSDLSAEQRTAIVGAGVVQVGLLASALTDLRRRPSEEINGSKAVWAAVSFVNFVGPIAYFAFGPALAPQAAISALRAARENSSAGSSIGSRRSDRRLRA